MSKQNRDRAPTNTDGDIVNRRTILKAAAVGICLPSLATAAFAQGAAGKTIRAIVPFSAGSGSDVTARTVLERVAEKLGQTIIVENRTGAGGTIGAGYVAKAEPDGTSLLMDASAHTTRPFFYRKLDFDPIKDFTTIGSIATIPLVMIISSSKGIKTAREFVDYAKANPGKVTYASGGSGSATHLAAERFRVRAGFQGTHVPFRGGPEGMREVLTGRVDFYFLPILPALQFVKNGQLVPLAVSTNQRSQTLPDVPTLAEAGFPDADYNFWLAAFGPPKTPDAIADNLHQVLNGVVREPAMTKKLAGFGAEPMLMSRAAFDEFIERELKVMGPLIAETGIKSSE
ncbi:MAG TPA: tripartite tricarboxylate transporter substrate-binding protein [Pseudolabrys sp.]